MRDLDPLCTARLRAERMTADHLPDVRCLHQDETFMAYEGGVRSESEIVAFVARNVEHWQQHGFGTWLLRDPSAGTTIGIGGLHHLDVEGVDEIEIGYGVLPQLWGCGLATELARACVDVARDTLHLRSVVALIHRDNAGSIRVAVKSGFEFDRRIDLPGGTAVLYRLQLDASGEEADR